MLDITSGNYMNSIAAQTALSTFLRIVLTASSCVSSNLLNHLANDAASSLCEGFAQSKINSIFRSVSAIAAVNVLR